MNTDHIRAVLETVMDPEIPVVSVVDLGIVREVTPERVRITPTYSGCPAMNMIALEIELALARAGISGATIRTVLHPAWTTDWITERGKEALNAYGISPPDLAKAATCPQCGSADTEEVSRFGSTPCKAQWRCKSCLEPFDRFKCH